MFRLLCAFVLAGFSLPSGADTTPPAGVTFNHVALSVEDAGRSSDFYRDVFGLDEITNRTEIEGIRWFSLGEGKELHLISVGYTPVSLNKAVHFALTTPDFDDFVGTLRRMEIAFSDFGGTPGEVSLRADGTRQLYLQDPDGYWIEVNSTAAD